MRRTVINLTVKLEAVWAISTWAPIEANDTLELMFILKLECPDDLDC